MELRGLENIVNSSVGTLHGITPPPAREDFGTEDEYAFACEVYARSMFWRASVKPA